MLALLIGAALALYGWRVGDRAISLIGFAIFVLGLGFLRYAALTGKSSLPHYGRTVLTGTIIDYPDQRESSVRVVIEPEGEHERVLVMAPVGTQLVYGDTVRVTGAIAVPKNFKTDTGRDFDYTGYLRRQGISREISFADIEVLEPASLSLKGALFAFRRAIEKQLHQTLSEPEGSLALGMLLGGKAGLGDELTKVFQRAGIIHIVVLSGYNIMLVAEGARLALARAPFFARMTGSGTFVVLFVLMAGAEPAALRAGAMALIALLARATGRPYTALRALTITAAAMTLWNPLILTHDPGFILSVLATLGIILLTDPISKKFSRIRWKFLREILATSTAAYAAVLPYLALQIGAVSTVALLVNPLVLPLVPFAMALGTATAVLAFVSPALALVTALPLILILRIMIAVARAFAALPLASLTVPAWSGYAPMFVYVGVGVWYWWYRKRKSPDTLARSGQIN